MPIEEIVPRAALEARTALNRGRLGHGILTKSRQIRASTEVAAYGMDAATSNIRGAPSHREGDLVEGVDRVLDAHFHERIFAVRVALRRSRLGELGRKLAL